MPGILKSETKSEGEGGSEGEGVRGGGERGTKEKLAVGNGAGREAEERGREEEEEEEEGSYGSCSSPEAAGQLAHKASCSCNYCSHVYVYI